MESHISSVSSNFTEETISEINITTKQLPWRILPQQFKDKYIEHFQGESNVLNYEAQIGVTVFYVLLLLVGLPGNIMTCIIIWYNSTSITPTNCFLLNLAVVDIMTLVTALPLEVYLIWSPFPWIFGLVGCQMMSVFTEIVAYVSIFTMIAFTFERFTAICYPLRPSLHSDKKRTKIIIVLVWLISFALSLEWTSFMDLKYITYGTENIPNTATCTLVKFDKEVGVYIITITTLMFIIPIITFPVAYYKIWNAMKSSVILQPQTTATHRLQRKRYIVIKMQVAVVVCFLICWGPYHIQRLSYIFFSMTSSWNSNILSFYQRAHFISGCMYFVNCVCNPFLYSLLSQRFRLGFHILLTNAFNCNKIVVQSFMNFSNGYSRSPQHYQPGSQGVRRSLPNAIVVYQNGEATMSWTKMSKLSREPTVRTTDV